MSRAYFEQGAQPSLTEWRHAFLSKSTTTFEQVTPKPDPTCGVGGMSGYEVQMADFLQKDENQLDFLRCEYVFSPAEGVNSFLREHRAVSEILLEAVKELKRCFGPNIVLQLQIFDDDGTPAAIYGIVLWKGDLLSARAALQTFDESWWIDSSRKAAGRIVFDYQLI